MYIPFGKHPEDVIENPWGSLTNDQADDVKAVTLKELAQFAETNLFGVSINLFTPNQFTAIIEKHDDLLGQDWLDEALDLPYSQKHHEAKSELWNAICDYVTEEAERIQINNGRGR